MGGETEEIDRRLLKAERNLEDAQDAVTGKGFIKRLDRESPYHPLLVGWRVSMFGSFFFAVGALAVLAMPVASPDLARSVAQFDVVPMLPLPGLLFIMALVCIAAGLSMRQLAIMRAQSSPLSPGEIKQHQRLVSDVQQAKSSKQMRQRKKDHKY